MVWKEYISANSIIIQNLTSYIYTHIYCLNDCFLLAGWPNTDHYTDSHSPMQISNRHIMTMTMTTKEWTGHHKVFPYMISNCSSLDITTCQTQIYQIPKHQIMDANVQMLTRNAHFHMNVKHSHSCNKRINNHSLHGHQQFIPLFPAS